MSSNDPKRPYSPFFNDGIQQELGLPMLEGSGSEYDVECDDAIAVTDVVILLAPMEVGDTISVTDSLVTSTQYERSVNDTIDVTDGLSLFYDVLLSDTVDTTDEAAALSSSGLEFNDSISITESILCETWYERSGEDAISLTDTADANNGAIVVNADDTIDVTDSTSTVTDYARFANDNVDVTDSTVRDTEVARSVSDDLDVTDQVIVVSQGTTSASDTISVTDSVLVARVIAVTATDTIALDDDETAAGLIFARVTDDTIDVTDAVEVDAVFDAITIEDETFIEMSYSLTVAASIAITDDLLAETSFPQDAISVTDSTATALVYSVTTDLDTIEIVEDTDASTFYTRDAGSDAISVTDTVSTTKTKLFNVDLGLDSVGITDTASRDSVFARSDNNSVSILDTVLRDVPYIRTADDTIDVTDETLVTRDSDKLLSDTISVTDSTATEVTRGLFFQDNIVVTDQLQASTDYVRPLSDSVAVDDSVIIYAARLLDVALSEVLTVTDTVLAESIDVDVEVGDVLFLDPEYLLREVSYVRASNDTINVTDTVLAKLGGEVDRSASDAIGVIDLVGYQLFPGDILDLITVVDTVMVERVTPLAAVMDADGFGLTVTLPGEVRYDRLEDNRRFEFEPFPGEGVPFQVAYADPVVSLYQSGATGEVVYQGGSNFFSPIFRITGGDPSSSSGSSGGNITASENLVISDSFKVEILGANPVTLSSGFVAGDVGGYIQVLNGRAPGNYRIISVLDPNRVTLDREMPVVDNANGKLDWRLTSAVQKIHFRTSNKITNQSNYFFRVHELLTRSGARFDYALDFYTSGINGPRVVATTVSEDGFVHVEYDQEMQSDRAFVLPSEYTITGPSTVRVKRAWPTGPNTVALETGGLEAGSYTLQVNYAGTPHDVAGNPIDPVHSAALFTGAIPLNIRSVFTDKGPIAKPGVTVQRGFGATIDDITELTLPGASLSSSQIGYYIRLGALGLPPTTASTVVGKNVTVTDTMTAPDALKVELVSPTTTTTVFTTLSGIYRLEGILDSDQARVSASFTPDDASNGSLFWELINPRNGEIADDPTDVMVKINGQQVAPQAVIGLLGQVVLNAIPATTDDVKIDYSWVCNPTVEFRQLNSKAFKLNSWNSDVTTGPSASQHKYRYNNTLIVPDDYEPLDTLAKLDQPEEREMHYRAYERAYTPVLNDPTLLLLNSPIHKIAFPPAQRPVSEEFVVYEATALPETEGWTRHGVGAAAVSAGVLTVTDNTSGQFPYGQPIFWTHDLDLTFPHAFALSWRFFLDTVPVYDGVFSGVAAGYTDEHAAYVVGFLTVSGVRKIGILKRGGGDDPSLVTSWTGGIDSGNNVTNAPVDFDWHILHSYRIFRDLNGVIRLFVDGDVSELLRILPDEAPFLEELGSPFDEIQGAFFGSISRPAESVSKWDFVRYLILPTNPLQTSPSSFVSYEGTVNPEVDSKPWTPIGFHGTETIISNNYLLLDSTSATDAATAIEVGLMGGDYKGFVRMEPLLTSASQVAIDVSVQLRTYTHGVDPYGLMFAVDDGTRLTQVAFLNDRSTPKFSYGGRSLPEDFSPYVWSSMGGATAEMVGRTLLISDTSTSDGRVYYIEDLELPTSDNRVFAAGTDYFLEFRNKVVSYTVDGSGFAGAFGQIFDGTRALGVMLSIVSGSPVVRLHADGVPVATFSFDWDDDEFHTYRVAKSTGGNLVTLFIDGLFVGSANYSAFAVSGGNAMASFGSSTPASSGARSVVEWAYCNSWRTRSDLKHYVGIWKGTDANSLTGYHLPLKVTGRNATVVGNALGDSQANFFTTSVAVGDKLIVDFGPNKGVYDVAGISSATTLTIVGTWPLSPTLADYRIVRETDWTALHQYRLVRDTTGDVSLIQNTDTSPIIRVGYNSIDLPGSGSGIVKTLTNGLAAIAFGSFSSENLEQSYWDFVRYGITRSPHELRIAPHHQVLNQWNVMQSPERLYTLLPHELTSFKSSSTGVVPKKSPDFLADPGLKAFTILNDSTPLVPSTQTFQVRAPFASQVYVSVLNSPEDVLNNDGDFILNDGTVQYRLIVPDDVLYSSLEVIEQSTGDEGLIAPFGDCCGPNFSGLNYTKEVCLEYTGDVLPENDVAAPTPWVRESDTPGQVFASVASGILTYGTFGSKTVYKNNTTLPDAPGLQTEASFRLRLRDDATLGTGDTQVRFGLSAPGLTCALAFVTTVLAERYVLIFDLNNGAILGSISFDFLDGLFHTYRIVRDPGAGEVRVSIDSDILSSSDIALMTDRPFVTDSIQTELL